MSKPSSIVAAVVYSLAITFIAPAIPSLVLPLVLSAAPAWAEGTPVRVRGTVVSLDGVNVSGSGRQPIVPSSTLATAALRGGAGHRRLSPLFFAQAALVQCAYPKPEAPPESGAGRSKAALTWRGHGYTVR